jgi:hypothetical protein
MILRNIFTGSDKDGLAPGYMTEVVYDENKKQISGKR